MAGFHHRGQYQQAAEQQGAEYGLHGHNGLPPAYGAAAGSPHPDPAASGSAIG